MDISIIEKATESTVISFLKHVYPQMSLQRLDFCGTLLHSIIRQGSTLLSKLSKDKIMCQACSGVAQGSKQPVDTTNKGIQERISRFLKDTDLNTDKYLLDNGMKHVSDDTTIAFDQSDISKEFGGGGMEGMAKGHDGSRGVLAMGHDVICASIVPTGRGEAIPLAVRLHKGRKGVPEASRQIISEIFEATKGKGNLVADRGYDSAENISFLAEHGYKATIRVKYMDRDVFANGISISETMKKEKTWSFKLRGAQNEINSTLRYKLGYFPLESSKKQELSPAQYPQVMVVSSSFGGKEIFLYAIRKSFEGKTEQELRQIAELSAQAYFDRWSIETFFLRVKQDFQLEDVRVRTFRRLQNLLCLCVLAYQFASAYIKEQKKEYDMIIKTIRDNLHMAVKSVKSFLSNLREILKADRVVFRTGRPRKERYEDNRQMSLFQDIDASMG